MTTFVVCLFVLTHRFGRRSDDPRHSGNLTFNQLTAIIRRLIGIPNDNFVRSENGKSKNVHLFKSRLPKKRVNDSRPGSRPVVYHRQKVPHTIGRSQRLQRLQLKVKYPSLALRKERPVAVQHQTQIGRITGNAPNSIITIASRGLSFVAIAIDGEPLQQNFVVNRLDSYRVFLERGSVITILARHEKGESGTAFATAKSPGLLVDVFVREKHQFSGVHKSFKARSISSPQHIHSSWSLRHFSSCDWPAAIPFKGGPRHGFPEKAKYIWLTKNGKAVNSIVIRYVVGGEKCSARENYCPCRPIPNTKSYCYYLRDKKLKVGRCKKRWCETKFECVPGARNLPICMRRYARYNVIKKDSTGWLRFCKRVKIDPPTVFWTPIVE